MFFLISSFVIAHGSNVIDETVLLSTVSFSVSVNKHECACLFFTVVEFSTKYNKNISAFGWRNDAEQQWQQTQADNGNQQQTNLISVMLW